MVYQHIFSDHTFKYNYYTHKFVTAYGLYTLYV